MHAMERLAAGERPETLPADEVLLVPSGGPCYGYQDHRRPGSVKWVGKDGVTYLWWTDRYYREDVWPGASE